MTAQHKNPAASRLTHAEYFKLANYMIARATDGKIDMRISKFAEEVKQVHDINVSYSSIRDLAKEHDIEMIKNKPGRKPAAKLSPTDDQLDAHFEQIRGQTLGRIEAKLDAIMNELDIEIPPSGS